MDRDKKGGRANSNYDARSSCRSSNRDHGHSHSHSHSHSRDRDHGYAHRAHESRDWEEESVGSSRSRRRTEDWVNDNGRRHKHDDCDSVYGGSVRTSASRERSHCHNRGTESCSVTSERANIEDLDAERAKTKAKEKGRRHRAQNRAVDSARASAVGVQNFGRLMVRVGETLKDYGETVETELAFVDSFK